MLPCSEVTRICASDELAGSPWHRRLAVRLHLFMCRDCARYVQELAAIGRAVRDLGAKEDEARSDAILKSVFGDSEGEAE